MNDQKLIDRLHELIENALEYLDQWLLEADPEEEQKIYKLIDLLEGRE
jgi:hypothetical protein